MKRLELYRKAIVFDGLSGWSVASITVDDQATSKTTPQEAFDKIQEDTFQGTTVHDQFLNEDIHITPQMFHRALEGAKYSNNLSLSIDLEFIPDDKSRKKPSEMVDWLKRRGHSDDEINAMIKFEKGLTK